MQIPLQTLRFSGSDQVRMGLVFFRKISRMGMSYSWPEMLPGQWVFDRPAHLLFDNLKPRRLMELLPSVTYSVNQARATARPWSPVLDTANVGVDGKFGVTSSVTLDGTVNPDFSQVESDAFQVEVNQRYPMFYSEKRPFFMEGMGLFNIAGTGGDGNMRTAVHTRRIVDPIWGSKLTGTVGKTTFGVLNAQDDHPQDVGDRGDVFTNRDKLFTIGRATYALRRSDYVGAIFTDTNHAGRHNQVIGGDVSVRPSSAQQVSATFLSIAHQRRRRRHRRQRHAGVVQLPDAAVPGDQPGRALRSRLPDGHGVLQPHRLHERVALQRGELLSRRRSGCSGCTRSCSRRAGTTTCRTVTRISSTPGFRFNFTRQGFFEVAHGQGHEAWQGQRYDVGNHLFVFGRMQAFRWLEFYAGNGRGPAIYYDDEDPFQGRSLSVFGGFTLQPNQHLSEDVEVDTVRFDRQSTGARVYDVRIINSKTTYQFDKHFLVRYQAQLRQLGATAS